MHSQNNTYKYFGGDFKKTSLGMCKQFKMLFERKTLQFYIKFTKPINFLNIV